MNRRLQLINWVKAQHEGQLIKKTSQPYFEHLLAVANAVAASAPLTYEIGLCHDLFEKTAATAADLQASLNVFGYEPKETKHIVNAVTELTRYYTKENNPLPKKERKALEDERLLTIGADSQTVKYADYTYNADWMIAHDRHHAADYLKTKLELLAELTEGDAEIHQQTIAHFKKLLRLL